MFSPSFPYKGNQVIISSGRVVAHSNDDFIFLFGKKGIGLSTNATVNLDVGERVIINSPKIELGYLAEAIGEPLLKGATTVEQLKRLISALINLSDSLSTLSATQPEIAISLIVGDAKILSNICKSVSNTLISKCLSNNTYTI